MVELVRYQDVLGAVVGQVGGQETVFLLDTAAGVTTLDRALAERLGLQPTGRFEGRRMTGETVALDLAPGVPIRLGDHDFEHETIGIHDLAGLLPPDWPALGGAIGLPTLEGATVTIDLAAECLRIDEEPSPDACEIHVRAARDGPSVDLFVKVDAPTRPLWMELDTGNTGPVIVSPEAVRALGWDAVPDEATLHVTGLGRVRTTVVEKPIRYDGNLGAPFFATRTLTLDVGAGRAWLANA